jgi:hypothetical protein
MPEDPPPLNRALQVPTLDSKSSLNTTAGSEPMPLSRTYFAAIPTCANTGTGKQQSTKTHIPYAVRATLASRSGEASRMESAMGWETGARH